MAGKYEMTDFTDEPIEVIIGNLRKGIASDCHNLLASARKVNAERRCFNLKAWEGRITKVREAELATYSLRDLNTLKKECQLMSAQLANFK
jgi:hypothetical protein